MKRLPFVALLLGALLAWGAMPALADQGQGEGHYLALGDSYAFAFSPLGDHSNAANYVGYADSVASSLGLTLTNAACPGETSGSMVIFTFPDNGCQHYRSFFPLHVSYAGAQLTYAVQFLESQRHTHLVTLQIGGNDVLLLQATCNADPTCIAQNLPEVEAQIASFLAVIYTAIRLTADYREPLVAVPYFAFNYNDPAQVAIITSLNGVVAGVAKRFHAKVADVFDAFAAASAPSGIPCLAGLQIVIPSGCDIHPSAAGHALIAKAILATLEDETQND